MMEESLEGLWPLDLRLCVCEGNTRSIDAHNTFDFSHEPGLLPWV